MSSTRRMLLLCPTFPPHPSPATHRARFLARYGPRHGWEPEVLTVDPAFYEEDPDVELTQLVPTGLRITRTPAIPVQWTRRMGIGDIGIRSYWHLRSELRRICATRRPDVIFIPGGPFYTFRLGADMWEEFGVPYVLDFTDPWVFPLGPGQDRPWKKAYWAHRLAVWLEPRAVRHAAHVLAVSDGTNDGIRARYPDLPAERFSAVPFGFEASDFDALRARPRPNPYWDSADGNLHLVYVGAMIPHAYETLRALFQAVLRLRADAPALGRRLRLHFFGTTYEAHPREGQVVPVAARMGLGDVVDERPKRIPYVEALNVLTSADGILALGSTVTHYTASKIFPCILARRPLLAVFHRASTVCDVMRETGAGELVAFSDEERPEHERHVSAIAGALERLLAPGGYDPGAVRLEGLAQYSAETMSGVILDVFERVASTSARPLDVRSPAAMVQHA